MTDFLLKATRCAICGCEGNAEEIYPARLPSDALRPSRFSARRLPDGVHYRLVKCERCGLVRSDPAADPQRLAAVYSQSHFGYGREVENLKSTYGRYLRLLELFGVSKGALLEIGCGNGFFLEEALRQGYEEVTGVEPSVAAVEQADPAIRPRIRLGMTPSCVLEPQRFDVVCLFQVLDHLLDPCVVLDECFKALKPGGLLLCLNHNVASLSARLLRESSPIVDVEHTYLFEPRTLRRLFELRGFEVERVAPAFNRYSLWYLIRIVPLPVSLKTLKAGLLSWLDSAKVGRLCLTIPLGNTYIVARRPVTTTEGRRAAV